MHLVGSSAIIEKVELVNANALLLATLRELANAMIEMRMHVPLTNAQQELLDRTCEQIISMELGIFMPTHLAKPR